MQMNLPNAIEGFRIAITEGTGWDTQDGARNSCGFASRAFDVMLGEMGLDHEWVPMRGLPDYARETLLSSEGSAELEWHVVTRHGDLYIDWTRRQYEPTAPFPWVGTRAQLEMEGWRLDLSPEELLEVTALSKMRRYGDSPP